MTPTLPALLALPLLLLSSAPGQALRGGEIAVADYYANGVFRVTPSGQVTVLHRGAPLVSPADVATTADREVVVVDFQGSLFRIGATGMVQVVSGLASPIRAAVDHNGDYIVTALSGKALLRVSPSGTVGTIVSGAPLNRPLGVAVDGSGDYLVADEGANALFRVTPQGQVTVVHQGAPFRLARGVAVYPNGDFAVIDGLVDAVFRVPRAGGNVTTVVMVPILGNPAGVVSDFQGGLYVSESGVPTGNRMVHVDPLGGVQVIASGAPFQHLVSLALAPFLGGPTRPTTGPGSSFPLSLDLPDARLKIYLLAMSLSVYPGFLLLPPDPRALALNPDWLFFSTLGASLPSLTNRWAGPLDQSGQAGAGVDFALLPPGALKGTRLHIQGFTLDIPSAAVVTVLNTHALLF